MAIAVFCPSFVLQSQLEGKTLRLGDCAFIPRLQKANWNENIEKETGYMPDNWWDIH